MFEELNPETKLETIFETKLEPISEKNLEPISEANLEPISEENLEKLIELIKDCNDTDFSMEELLKQTELEQV